MAKKTGLPSFHEELCKLLGVKDNTKGESPASEQEDLVSKNLAEQIMKAEDEACLKILDEVMAKKLGMPLGDPSKTIADDIIPVEKNPCVEVTKDIFFDQGAIQPIDYPSLLNYCPPSSGKSWLAVKVMIDELKKVKKLPVLSFDYEATEMKVVADAVGKEMGSFIKDKLKEQGFAKTVLTPKPMGTVGILDKNGNTIPIGLVKSFSMGSKYVKGPNYEVSLKHLAKQYLAGHSEFEIKGKQLIHDEYLEYPEGKEASVAKMTCVVCNAPWGECQHSAGKELTPQGKAYKKAMKQYFFAKAYGAGEKLLNELQVKCATLAAQITGSTAFVAEQLAKHEWDQANSSYGKGDPDFEEMQKWSGMELVDPPFTNNSDAKLLDEMFTEPKTKVVATFHAAEDPSSDQLVFYCSDTTFPPCFVPKVNLLAVSSQETIDKLKSAFYLHFKQVWKKYGKAKKVTLEDGTSPTKTFIDGLYIHWDIGAATVVVKLYNGKGPWAWLPDELMKYTNPQKLTPQMVKVLTEPTYQELQDQIKNAAESINLLEAELKKMPSSNHLGLNAVKSALNGWKSKKKSLETKLKTGQYINNPEPLANDLDAVSNAMMNSLGVPPKFLKWDSLDKAFDDENFVKVPSQATIPQGPLTPANAMQIKQEALKVAIDQWPDGVHVESEAQLFKLQVLVLSLHFKGWTPLDLAQFITARTPICCPYALPDDCTSKTTLEAYFTNLKYLHFEKKHSLIGPDLEVEEVADALDKAFKFAKAPNWGPIQAATWFNNQIPNHELIPQLAPQTLTDKLAVEQYAMALGEGLAEYREMNPTQAPEGFEVFELTLTGLTKEEVDKIMKTIQKTKTQNDILVHKTTRKELGSNSKALVVWPFESGSMQVNQEPVLYKTQLNKDGTLSCNCMGWTMGSAKAKNGRFCKHTKSIEVEAGILFKEWKKTGKIKGENFEVVSEAAVSAASAKTLFKALKEKPKEGETTIFKASRIVEI